MTLIVGPSGLGLLYGLLIGCGMGVFIGLILARVEPQKEPEPVQVQISRPPPVQEREEEDPRAPFVVPARASTKPRAHRTRFNPPPYQDPEARLDEKEAFFEDLKMEQYE